MIPLSSYLLILEMTEAEMTHESKPSDLQYPPCDWAHRQNL